VFVHSIDFFFNEGGHAMKRYPLVFAVLMLAVFAAGWTGQGEKAASPRQKGEPEKQKGEDKIQDLLKERRNALKEAIKALEGQIKSGQRFALDETWIQAQRQLTDTELELCHTDRERIPILERAVATAVEWEKLIKTRLEAGMANISRVDFQLARADRLAVEIALERAKLNASQSK
jgi:hypothetical protein